MPWGRCRPIHSSPSRKRPGHTGARSTGEGCLHALERRSPDLSFDHHPVKSNPLARAAICRWLTGSSCSGADARAHDKQCCLPVTPLSCARRSTDRRLCVPALRRVCPCVVSWSKPHCNNVCNLSEYADTFSSQLVFYLTTQIVALMTPLRALSRPVVEYEVTAKYQVPAGRLVIV